MGRKARRTKWRTLEIADEQSDSEESNDTSGPGLPKAYQQKSFYNKFPYSSQSTPRRRYQHDGTKSTRSSSTASETKITFNEDEYTRITTPRQDVLFKKGYLNKPKNYQSQTSTGTSTTSTGNSTGNGTPDHHSTDLEYESQFVFPNGFLDQNGIYFVNGYEPYPLMLYNPPTYYTEVSNGKTKRYSTGSLTESTSPNNEEATSQDMSGGEASNNVSDYSGHHHVYNVMYPGYYVNGVCPSQDVTNDQSTADQTRRVKKLRRRKTSRSQVANNNGDSSELSEDESDSCTNQTKTNTSTAPPAELSNAHTDSLEDRTVADKTIEDGTDETNESVKEHVPVNLEMKDAVENPDHIKEESRDCSPKPRKYDLKPDAEEFVPRAYRTPEIPLSPVQFIKVPPNFVPIPVVPFNGQNFNPAFIPPGIPVNFLPHDPKMYPNFVGFLHTPPAVEENAPIYQNDTVENCDKDNTAKEDNIKIEQPIETAAPTSTVSTNTKSIDIATVVSKLKEAVKEQNNQIEDHQKTNVDMTNGTKRNGFVKSNRLNQKYRNQKRNYYNSIQNSPLRFNGEPKVNGYHENGDTSYNNGYVSEPNTNSSKEYYIPNGHPRIENNKDNSRYVRSSPEKFRKSWKPNFQNGTMNKPQLNGIHKPSDYRQKTRVENNRNKPYKHYSETVKQNVSQKNLLMNNSESHCEKTPESPKVIVVQTNTVSVESTPTKTVSSQWISVSNRKKRKNKLLDENEAAFDDHDELQTDSDQFETYDVSMLVDVMPKSEENDNTVPRQDEDVLKVEIPEQNVEEIINIVAQNEAESIENISLLSVDIKSVTEVENELIIKTESEKMEEQPQINEIEKQVEQVVIEENVEQSKPKPNKKSKKGSQKSLVKRVIITDVDLSEKCEELKTPVKKIVCKIAKPLETEKPNPGESPNPNDDDEKKKSKKKKKKSKGEASYGSVSSSSSILTPNDESYDLLLDSALAVDAESKTNDEISQELDKIIQKGMYSSLEEKIKSLNLDEGDGFFKSVFSTISTSRESSVEKVGFTKTPDFSRILQNTRSMFKPAPVSEEIDLDNTTTNSLLPALDSTPANGIFLENVSVKDILLDQQKEEDKDTGEEAADKSEVKTLYPITEAVKEWMCRTRETTPDVEILKSPSEIYQEFYDGVSDSETETEVKNLSDELSASIDDDEVTLFVPGSTQESRESSQDILEYWEDDLNKSSESVINVNSGRTDEIEVAEEPIEVYESKYGQNEDFLNLQREIQEKTRRVGSTRNADLPHRAICCSIM